MGTPGGLQVSETPDHHLLHPGRAQRRKQEVRTQSPHLESPLQTKPCWVRRHPVTPEQSSACSSPGELRGHGADGHSAGWCPSTRLQEDLSDDLLSGPILPFAPEGVQQKTRSLRRIPQGLQRGRHLTAPLRGLVLHE